MCLLTRGGKWGVIMITIDVRQDTSCTIVMIRNCPMSRRVVVVAGVVDAGPTGRCMTTINSQQNLHESRLMKARTNLEECFHERLVR